MSRIMLRGAILVFIALLLAVPAAAAGGDAEGNPWVKFGWELVNLAVLIGAIVYFGRKPVQKFFGERREKIRGDLGDAAKILAEAEARLAEWQERMGELDAEIEKIRTTERRRSEREREKILEEAQQAAERIHRDAGTAVEREIRRAREALRKEAAELALEMAGRLLHERMGDDDQTRLVDEFIARVESSDSAETPGNSRP